jgi:hypothetical protein
MQPRIKPSSSEDSFRYGKYSGLTDEGFAPLVDFIWQKRPEWDSGDTVRWRLQGWRLGLDSRRLAFDYNDQGTQKFRFDFRSIPNNRFSDGMTPYRPQQPGLWNLAPEWEVAPGSSNTLGFTNLQETLVRLNVDTKRQWFDLGYDRRLGSNWKLDVDWKHETKEGNRQSPLRDPAGPGGLDDRHRGGDVQIHCRARAIRGRGLRLVLLERREHPHVPERLRLPQRLGARGRISGRLRPPGAGAG